MTAAIDIVDAEHWALPGLAEKIKNATAAAEASARSAMQNALLAGELLTEAKGHVQHGKWEEWVLSNCSLAPRTAQAYMRLHKKLGQTACADVALRRTVAAQSQRLAPRRATTAAPMSRPDISTQTAVASASGHGLMRLLALSGGRPIGMLPTAVLARLAAGYAR